MATWPVSDNKKKIPYLSQPELLKDFSWFKQTLRWRQLVPKRFYPLLGQRSGKGRASLLIQGTGTVLSNSKGSKEASSFPQIPETHQLVKPSPYQARTDRNTVGAIYRLRTPSFTSLGNQCSSLSSHWLICPFQSPSKHQILLHFRFSHYNTSNIHFS